MSISSCAGRSAIPPHPTPRPAAAAAGDPGERITEVVGAVTVSEAVEGSGLHLVQVVFAEHGRYGRLDREVLPTSRLSTTTTDWAVVPPSTRMRIVST